MPSDPKLVEIARAAEAERTLPLLRLSTAAQLIVGIPGPSPGFNKATWGPVVDELQRRINRDEGAAWSRKAQKKRAEVVGERWEFRGGAASGGMGSSRHRSRPDPPENLTIYDAVVWAWAESSGLRYRQCGCGSTPFPRAGRDTASP